MLTFSAYWGRDPTTAAAAAANPLFNAQFNAAAAAGLGLLPNPTAAAAAANDRYSMAAAAAAAAAGHHHQNTMAVAASQAASLAGLHPASELLSTVYVLVLIIFEKVSIYLKSTVGQIYRVIKRNLVKKKK